MLSRRSVRVKVMQTIYNWFQDKNLSIHDVNGRYHENVNMAYELLIFNLRNLVLICRMSVEDKEKRNQKYLITEEDRNFKSHIYRNDIIARIEDNPEFKKHKGKFNDFLDVSQARKIYQKFAKTDEYKAYINKGEHDNNDHVDILIFLWKFLCQNELYIELVYDAYPNWIDDDSLVKGFLKRIIRGVEDNERVLQEFKPDAETVNEFGESLLEDVIENFESYNKRLIPFLKNWEIERVAIIDRILIKMALSEFLSFSSIPTKVTLNEYVEIAKMYSTDKSKEFLNGILDAVLKDLQEADEIQKRGRGLIQ
ncbi:transcription antitermination factor NusB [Membranihabitans maritimus]|uniref:transcription antitermination factor NusB n=1 Tax=Membranihabitans maritimus TaxID=2904244 RepID=UPI001F028FA1|nr:transcription antitermination factor NusB [Membranihabitans maritimus]